MSNSDPLVRARHLRNPAVALLTQLPLLIALVVLWLVLWRHVDLISLVTGVVFSLTVVRVFELPPVLLSGRMHPWFFAVLLGKVLWWLLTYTFQIAWLALWPRPVPVSSIIAVRLRVHSDWLLTLCAEINMLVPGSVVVEVDRARSILYLHVIGADCAEKIVRARRAAEAIEDAVVKALGNHEDLALINEDRERRGMPALFASRAQRRYEQRRCQERAERERIWAQEL